MVDPVSSVTWNSTLSAMSLCVHCSVKHPYIALSLHHPMQTDLPWISVEWLVFHGCLSVLGTGVCTHVVASHSPLFRCQFFIPQACLSFVLSSVCLCECLRFASFLVYGLNFSNRCSFDWIEHEVFVFCHCYPCHKQYVLTFFHVCFAICSGVVVDVLLRCLAFSSDIHKPNVPWHCSNDILSLLLDICRL